MVSSSSSSGGCGVLSLLLVAFIVLKLGVGDTAVVGWSWWWVFAPLWGIPAICLGLFVVGGTAYFLWNGLVYPIGRWATRRR